MGAKRSAATNSKKKEKDLSEFEDLPDVAKTPKKKQPIRKPKRKVKSPKDKAPK